MEYKYTPKTKKELTDAIRAEIKLQGCRADLNCIDTSAITNMYELFSKFRTFDGDISGWNVSNVTNMARMFAESHFNGDIGGWDVSRVEDMTEMFYFSRFKGDIRWWDVDNVKRYHPMFRYSSLPEENRPFRFRKRTRSCEEFLSALPKVLEKVHDLDEMAEVLLIHGHLIFESACGAPKNTLVYRLTDGAVAVTCSKGQYSYGIYKGVVDSGEYEFFDGKKFDFTITGDGVLRISGNLDHDLEYVFNDGVPIPSESFFDRLVIEEGITRIGDRMFENWKQLRAVSLPKSLQVLGKRAFSYCGNLSELSLSPGLQEIGILAFAGCSEIKEIKLPKTLRTIRNSAFYDCESLERVELPPHLESIGKEAFSRCYKLGGVVLPKSLKDLSPRAFDNFSFDMDSLTFTVENYAASGNAASVCAGDCDKVSGSLVIPSEVEHEGRLIRVVELEEGAFMDCKELREVRLPDSVTVIPEDAFRGCRRLRRVHFGRNTKAVMNNAFLGCNCLRELNLPDSVEVVKNYAFDGCGNLLFVNRPAALKEIGRDSFSGSAVPDPGPGAVYWNDIFMGYNGDLPPKTVFEVRKGVTLIAAGALSRESNLSAVILPSTVRYIGRRAFDTRQSLIVEAPWKKPVPVGEEVFNTKSTILVPQGSLEKYKADPEWGKYKLEEK